MNALENYEAVTLKRPAEDSAMKNQNVLAFVFGALREVMLILPQNTIPRADLGVKLTFTLDKYEEGSRKCYVQSDSVSVIETLKEVRVINNEEVQIKTRVAWSRRNGFRSSSGKIACSLDCGYVLLPFYFDVNKDTLYDVYVRRDASDEAKKENVLFSIAEDIKPAANVEKTTEERIFLKLNEFEETFRIEKESTSRTPFARPQTMFHGQPARNGDRTLKPSKRRKDDWLDETRLENDNVKYLIVVATSETPRMWDNKVEAWCRDAGIVIMEESLLSNVKFGSMGMGDWFEARLTMRYDKLLQVQTVIDKYSFPLHACKYDGGKDLLLLRICMHLEGISNDIYTARYLGEVFVPRNAIDARLSSYSNKIECTVKFVRRPSPHSKNCFWIFHQFLQIVPNELTYDDGLGINYPTAPKVAAAPFSIDEEEEDEEEDEGELGTIMKDREKTDFEMANERERQKILTHPIFPWDEQPVVQQPRQPADPGHQRTESWVCNGFQPQVNLESQAPPPVIFDSFPFPDSDHQNTSMNQSYYNAAQQKYVQRGPSRQDLPCSSNTNSVPHHGNNAAQYVEQQRYSGQVGQGMNMTDDLQTGLVATQTGSNFIVFWLAKKEAVFLDGDMLAEHAGNDESLKLHLGDYFSFFVKTVNPPKLYCNYEVDAISEKVSNENMNRVTVGKEFAMMSAMVKLETLGEWSVVGKTAFESEVGPCIVSKWTFVRAEQKARTGEELAKVSKGQEIVGKLQLELTKNVPNHKEKKFCWVLTEIIGDIEVAIKNDLEEDQRNLRTGMESLMHDDEVAREKAAAHFKDHHERNNTRPTTSASFSSVRTTEPMIPTGTSTPLSSFLPQQQPQSYQQPPNYPQPQQQNPTLQQHYQEHQIFLQRQQQQYQEHQDFLQRQQQQQNQQFQPLPPQQQQQNLPSRAPSALPGPSSANFQYQDGVNRSMNTSVMSFQSCEPAMSLQSQQNPNFPTQSFSLASATPSVVNGNTPYANSVPHSDANTEKTLKLLRSCWDTRGARDWFKQNNYDVYVAIADHFKELGIEKRPLGGGSNGRDSQQTSQSNGVQNSSRNTPASSFAGEVGFGNVEGGQQRQGKRFPRGGDSGY